MLSPRSFQPSFAFLPVLAFIGLCGSIQAAVGQTFENSLIPEPRSVSSAPGAELRIDPSLTIVVDPQLRGPAERLLRELQNSTGIWFSGPWKSEATGPAIVLSVQDEFQVFPHLNMDESYKIESDGHAVRLEAVTVFGLQRGIATLLQLIQADKTGYYIPAVEIQDAPRFSWRGLMIDPGRHFLPVDSIYRTLDAMAAVKLNVLHIHLTENQGFRIESKRFPKLTSMGSEGEFYTQEQMRGLISYAAALGIRVVPEFDVPGHSTSWFVGYPELASGPGPYKVEHTFGIHDEALDPTRESTYTFLDAFLGEMAKLFPDEYVHIGGDESNGKQWLANPQIVAFMKAHNLPDTHALQAYFIERVYRILAKHGKKMIGWDEITDPNLPTDAVIQNWHGVKLLTASAKQGRVSVYSKPYYLDHGVSAEAMYESDPIPPDAGLSGSERNLVLGGEVCMWGEQVTADTIDSRMWPRSAAVAERLWSPASVNDVDDLYRRLAVESFRLDGEGIDQIAGPTRLLRQLSGELQPRALETLASAVEPYTFHDRAHAQHNVVETPMNGFVDAAIYDPPLRHELPYLIDSYLAGDAASRARAGARLKSLFNSWQSAGAELATGEQPRLQILRARAYELSELGRLGQAAIAALDKGGKLTAAESAQVDALQSAAIADDPSLVRFVVLPPMGKLFTQAR